ncbi:had superfamily phosphatase protein [Rutstroemia sp. NJR-2017a WRK4]|nr:had superfamily phosphatase protein [Rutstroemia sp. NJR-2017a BBW]PQE33472.1 had superfamily phosphatase protein [Rutstroemia sp. NJR-2017a WRK4]
MSMMITRIQESFKRLREAYPGRRLLIVSNTSGALSLDRSGKLADEVMKSTGVTVLPHSTKKPGCGPEIMEYFLKYPETGVTRPDQIAVVGDRLTTDVMMANLMGSYAIWVKDGVVPVEETSVFARLEQKFAQFLIRRGYQAPDPASPFEK